MVFIIHEPSSSNPLDHEERWWSSCVHHSPLNGSMILMFSSNDTHHCQGERGLSLSSCLFVCLSPSLSPPLSSPSLSVPLSLSLSLILSTSVSLWLWFMTSPRSPGNPILISLSVCLSVCLPVYLSICPSLYISLNLSLYLSLFLIYDVS